VNLPVAVIEAVREDSCTLFVGSRFTGEAVEVAGGAYPSGKALAKALGWTRPRLRPGARPTPITPSVSAGAAVYAAAHGASGLAAMLKAQIGAVDVAPTTAHRSALARFPVIHTTCQDDMLERAAADAGLEVQVHHRGDPLPEPVAGAVQIYKWRGSIDAPATLRAGPAPELDGDLRKALRKRIRAHTILFVGYRPDEEEFESVFSDLSECTGGELPRCHLAVAQGRIDDYQWQRWVWRGLLLFTADPTECMDMLEASLST
jgi:hypothetical protein